MLFKWLSSRSHHTVHSCLRIRRNLPIHGICMHYKWRLIYAYFYLPSVPINEPLLNSEVNILIQSWLKLFGFSESALFIKHCFSTDTSQKLNICGLVSNNISWENIIWIYILAKSSPNINKKISHLQGFWKTRIRWVFTSSNSRY